MNIAFVHDISTERQAFNGSLMRTAVGLSGTETSLVYLAETMARHGHQVTFLSNHCVTGLDRGVLYVNAEHYAPQRFDLVVDTFLVSSSDWNLQTDHLHVVMQCATFGRDPFNGRRSHQQAMRRVQQRQGFSRLTFSAPSEWARDSFLYCYGDLLDEGLAGGEVCIVTGNAIEPGSLIPDPHRRVPNSLIFHSVHERGGAVYDAVCERLDLPGKSYESVSYHKADGKRSAGKDALFRRLETVDYALFPLVLPSGMVHKDTYNCAILEAMAAGAICIAPRIRPLECIYGDRLVYVELPPGHNHDLNTPVPFVRDLSFLEDDYVQGFVDVIERLARDDATRERQRAYASAWAATQTWEARYRDDYRPLLGLLGTTAGRGPVVPSLPRVPVTPLQIVR
jgi:glycosyltransferase involved in cell wall biosynthesis